MGFGGHTVIYFALGAALAILIFAMFKVALPGVGDNVFSHVKSTVDSAFSSK